MNKGIFPVYKPLGISSYDVIRKLKKHFPGEKIGHGGTLDPLAEGVLVVGVGKEATRQLQTVLKGTNKTYEAGIELGKISETDDSEGPISESIEWGGEVPTREEVEKVLATFLGETQQIPPKYSAIKIKGVPAYTRARRGEEFDIEPKTITIRSIDLLEYNFPSLSVRVVAGSGTYIRSLARDIGKALGCGAYMKALKRTAVGEYTIDEAHILENV